MSRFPTDPKKIRASIKRYEKNLRTENYRDGSGSRYLVGPLYLSIGDLEGARQYYEWYEKEFTDDMVEAFNHLCWTLVLLRSGNLKEARIKLIRTYLGNNFIIPAVLGIPHGQPELKRGCNWEDEDYVSEGNLRLLVLWSAEELVWLRAEWENPAFQRIRKRDLEINQALSTEGVGERRSQLVSEQYGLRNDLEATAEQESVEQEPVEPAPAAKPNNLVFLSEWRK